MTLSLHGLSRLGGYDTIGVRGRRLCELRDTKYVNRTNLSRVQRVYAGSGLHAVVQFDELVHKGLPLHRVDVAAHGGVDHHLQQSVHLCRSYRLSGHYTSPISPSASNTKVVTSLAVPVRESAGSRRTRPYQST